MLGHIENGDRIDIEPKSDKIMGDQTGAEAGEGLAKPGVFLGEPPIDGAGRIEGRDRRLQPLDPAALLIHQYGGGGVVHSLAQGGVKRPDLVSALDIAREQDEAIGPHRPKEGGLLRGQPGTRAAIKRR